MLEPALSGDVSPLQGNVTFKEGEHLQNLTLFSVPDDVSDLFNCNIHANPQI